MATAGLVRWVRWAWCAVHAKLKAIRGRESEAVRFAETACELAERTDDTDGQGQALAAFAEVLYRLGRTEDADGKLAAAVARFESKGNMAAASITARLFESIEKEDLGKAG